jgi:hypothetical protein
MKTGFKPSRQTQLSSTGGLAMGGAGALTGLFISSASATPTVTIYDNTAGSGTVLVPTFTPVAGTMYNFPDGGFNTGCYVVLSGTVTGVAFTRS